MYNVCKTYSRSRPSALFHSLTLGYGPLLLPCTLVHFHAGPGSPLSLSLFFSVGEPISSALWTSGRECPPSLASRSSHKFLSLFLFFHSLTLSLSLSLSKSEFLSSCSHVRSILFSHFFFDGSLSPCPTV